MTHTVYSLFVFRNRVELLFWSLATLTAAISIFCLIGIAAQIWIETPLMGQISEEGIPIEELLYPTITICAPDLVMIQNDQCN